LSESIILGGETEAAGGAASERDRETERMFVEKFRVESPGVRYGAGEIESEYRYDTTEVVPPGDGGAGWVVRPKSVTYHFKTSTSVPKLGCVCKTNGR
jgi:hypothetical protein